MALLCPRLNIELLSVLSALSYALELDVVLRTPATPLAAVVSHDPARGMENDSSVLPWKPTHLLSRASRSERRQISPVVIYGSCFALSVRIVNRPSGVSVYATEKDTNATAPHERHCCG
jgi:hypothetical protein